jgi:5'-deoxynucleotidase YfbR-like HD superfamily hydrolase
VVGVVDFGVHDLGEAEVGDLDVPDAAARQQNVAWSYEK